ncbi:MAG TPA: DUF72 domain-containing protein [Syntrophorhabdaceae bacterium]|jgi:uncharacterized protein YecE (DUF72 family)
MEYHIGTSGWQYPHWKGPFYPEGVKNADWLAYYAGRLDTLELNVTFYRQVKDSTFLKWYETTPAGFLFSVKMSRFITHLKRLRVDSEPIGRFTDSVRLLKDKLGVVLIQLPPGLRYDEGLVTDFFQLLDGSFRYAVEARNPGFVSDSFFTLLRKHNMAWCIADSAGRYPYREEVTADFVYIRLHGGQQLYASDYGDKELEAWREKIEAWGKETFVYFDNDYSGFAAKNALTLKGMVEREKGASPAPSRSRRKN